MYPPGILTIRRTKFLEEKSESDRASEPSSSRAVPTMRLRKERLGPHNFFMDAIDPQQLKSVNMNIIRCVPR